ncbi:helix-turn-helix transcriptional regulator [Nocardiopsis dassonvillei]|uniref:helix-turn-helix transcriptional regulator n=1 Tax=Nocardiopsis dassonvillei TaxID=2014 RepID=UPI003F5492D4
MFIGRRAELDALCDHARRTRTTGPGMILLGGDAGVGKSRLISEFAATLPPGAVYVGACLQLGGDGLSYAPFTAILRQLLRERGPELFAAAAPGGTRELARLLPELPEPGGPSTDRVGTRGLHFEPENRGILFEQVLRLLYQSAGDEGVTFVLEDLHWADGATRDLLVFLIRNLELPGVQIIATYRSDDLHRAHPLRRLLPELERVPGVESLRLAPLTLTETGEHAAALRGGDALAPHELDELYRRTEGVPLFVETLADSPTGHGDVPDRFRDLLLEPLQRFDHTAWTVLRTASVGAVSGGIDHEVLRQAADLPDPDLEAALHALVDANVLKVHGEGYRFRHALLRDAVHGELLPGPHTRLHMRFARLIDERPDLFPYERRASEEAHHYMAARELPEALQAAWWAAVRASDTLAYSEALDMLERVLSLWDRVPDARDRVQGHSWAEVVSRAAGAAVEAGRGGRALELADEALATLPEDPADDETRTVKATLLRRRGLARSLTTCGGGITDLVAALDLHPPHMPGYASLLSILARESLRHRADRVVPPDQEQLRDLREAGHSARALAERAIALAESSDAADRCAAADARITLGSLHIGEGDLERGRPLIEEAMGIAAEVSEPSLEARGAGNLGHFLRELGRHEEGLRVLEESLDRHKEMGWASVHETFNHQNRAEIHFELGHLAEARAICEKILRTRGPLKDRSYVDAVLARSAAAMGDLDTALTVSGWSRSGRLTDAQRMNIVQLDLLAKLETGLAEGSVDAVLALSERALEQLELEASRGYTWPLVDVMAQAAARGAEAGRGEGGRSGVAAAHRVMALAVKVAEAMAVTGTPQRAHRARVLAYAAELDGTGPADRLDLWERAVAAWEDTPMPLHLAAARLRAARAAVAAGERDRARELVRAAHAAADRHEAVPLAASAADLARRIGVGLTDEASAPAAPAGLTARELEVARLLAVGSTNARIAQELFISAKTASVHVSNILAKLGVPNRATAGARLRELGLG